MKKRIGSERETKCLKGSALKVNLGKFSSLGCHIKDIVAIVVIFKLCEQLFSNRSSCKKPNYKTD